ncbi:patched domain-containing protein 3-like [Sardina pilchardus]|uniref:patched domain-containing protein 3-like n=1 Tax=Sardina pilchardus TaxID=27697 RepID=UPI002E13C3F2
MPNCNTNCIEKPISIGFGKLGRIVARYPWVFLISPLIISAGLGAGFYFLEDRESNNIEDQFTPKNGLAKTERAYVKEHFPQGEEFSSLRLYTDGTYASLIAVHSANILTKDVFEEVVKLDQKVKQIQAEGSQKTFTDLCAKDRDLRCVSNPILDIVNDYVTNGTSIDYPQHKTEFIGTAIGGVDLYPNNSVETAQAIRLFYYLKEDKKNETDLWLKTFIKNFSGSTVPEMISVSYFTSISREEEFDTNSKTVIPLFSVTYFLAITVSIMSCLRLDCVRNKVWVATFGVLSAGLAVLSSFGLLLFCGMPFVMTVATAPFLILGIGVDDMFIMISCWQKTKVKTEVEDRMAETYKEAAVSITITTLTNVLAFYIGLLTPFGSVQSFCMYTGTAILFCYIYNITFFGAFLALNGRRESSNRHWLTCRMVETPTPDNKSNACSVGGAFDPETKAEEEMPMDIFFKKHYGPFLTKPWTKVLVVLLYSGYLAGSIYGCFQMQEGIDLKNLAPDDSYVAPYYNNEDIYFSEYGPFVMLVIEDENFKYWGKFAREILNMCLNEFESSDMVAKNRTIFWLESYEQYGVGASLDLSDETVFMSNLPTFLIASGFKHDLNISNNKIVASRLFIPTVNIRTAIDEKNMLNFFRDTASTCFPNLDLMVYHPAFIYYDQYAVIVSNTIQNTVVATVIMLVISLLLIPHPLCSLWVTFAIASVIVGVAGFMALWDVNLDSISMINLIICIGFSVDFSAHISYAFVSSEEKTANEKAIDALYHLGYPIIQGAVSTIAGVVVLSAAESYIFRTFFKIMFLVILFGALHGIVFIPIFLTFFGCCSKSNSVQDEKDQPSIKQYFRHGNVQLSLNGVVSPKHRFPGSTAITAPNPHPYPNRTQASFDQNQKQNSSVQNYQSNPDCP